MSFETADLTCIKLIAAVIRDQLGRILVVRKAGTDMFMQPGGKPMPGEYPLDTLAREIREELGCDIDRETAEHFSSCQAPAAFEPDCIVEAELYRVTLIGDPVASSEIAEIKWITPENPDQLSLAPLTRGHVFERLSS